MKQRWWTTVGACILALPASLDAAQLLAVEWDNFDSPVYSVDAEGGSVQLLGYSGVRGLNSLAAGPDARLYSAASYPDHSLLVEINPHTGVATPIATIDQPGIRDLAFTTDGTLYGTLGSGKVIRIDPFTGATELVIQTSFFNMGGLATAPDGTLYAWDSDAGLVLIDPLNQTALDVNSSMDGLATIQGMTFLPDGSLLGMRSSIFLIDTITGQATELHGLGTVDLRGTALTPEPAALLLAVGLAGPMLSRHTRRRLARASTPARH